MGNTTPKPTGNPEIHEDGKVDRNLFFADLETVAAILKGYEPDIDDGKVDSVVITARHAYSLVALVQQFKRLVESGVITQSPGRTERGGTGYFDELLEDLGGNSVAPPQSDIVDGKATRDIKKGENMTVHLKDLESLRYRPEPRKGDGGPQ